MFRRILVAIDGSPHAERALAEAADLAAAANSTLTVMTVVPDMSSWNLGGAGFGAYVPIQTLEDLREQTERGYQGMLDAAVETLPSDVSLTKVVDHGRPASRAVRDNRDLIVMGPGAAARSRRCCSGASATTCYRPVRSPSSSSRRRRAKRLPGTRTAAAQRPGALERPEANTEPPCARTHPRLVAKAARVMPSTNASVFFATRLFPNRVPLAYENEFELGVVVASACGRRPRPQPDLCQSRSARPAFRFRSSENGGGSWLGSSTGA